MPFQATVAAKRTERYHSRMKATTQTHRPELAEALVFLGEIEKAKARLKEIGVLRSDRDPACDFAEWWAAQVCGLDLAVNAVEPAYDAVDHQGRKYQIKSRRVVDLNEPTSFDFRKVAGFDFLVTVFLARATLEPLAVYQIPYAFVKEHLSDNLRFRWNRAVRQQVEAAGYGPVEDANVTSATTL